MVVNLFQIRPVEKKNQEFHYNCLMAEPCKKSVIFSPSFVSCDMNRAAIVSDSANYNCWFINIVLVVISIDSVTTENRNISRIHFLCGKAITRLNVNYIT